MKACKGSVSDWAPRVPFSLCLGQSSKFGWRRRLHGSLANPATRHAGYQRLLQCESRAQWKPGQPAAECDNSILTITLRESHISQKTSEIWATRNPRDFCAFSIISFLDGKTR
jgi:hypothetical protein